MLLNCKIIYFCRNGSLWIFLVEKRPMTFYIFVLTLYCLNLLQNMYEPVQKIDSDSENICKQYHRCLKELHFMIGLVLILLLNDWQYIKLATEVMIGLELSLYHWSSDWNWINLLPAKQLRLTLTFQCIYEQLPPEQTLFCLNWDYYLWYLCYKAVLFRR
jgi:hypothetical protein